jgi:hypothetical protein
MLAYARPLGQTQWRLVAVHHEAPQPAAQAARAICTQAQDPCASAAVQHNKAMACRHLGKPYYSLNALVPDAGTPYADLQRPGTHNTAAATLGRREGSNDCFATQVHAAAMRQQHAARSRSLARAMSAAAMQVLLEDLGSGSLRVATACSVHCSWICCCSLPLILHIIRCRQLSRGASWAGAAAPSSPQHRQPRRQGALRPT